MQVMRVAQGTHARDVTSTTKPTRLSDVHTFVKVAGIAQTSCLLQERKGSFLGSAVHTTCRIPDGKAQLQLSSYQSIEIIRTRHDRHARSPRTSFATPDLQ
jgi:hypothetical protein